MEEIDKSIVNSALEEEIIIVDEKDSITGYGPRSYVCRNEIYRVSALWIQNSKGEILLAQRAFTKKKHPGRWSTAVAGTNARGETYESNIIKEAEEELGLKNISIKKTMKEYHIEEKGERLFIQWFFSEIDIPIEELQPCKEEVEAVKWYRAEELKKEIIDNPEKYSKKILPLIDYFSRFKQAGETTSDCQE